MNQVISSPSVRIVLKGLDRVISILSCVSIPLLVSVTIFWYVDPYPSQQYQTVKVIEATGGTDVDVSSPVAFHIKTRKAFYQIIIRDRKGDSIYVYPEQVLQNPTEFNLSKLRISLPDLDQGAYTVHAQLTYGFNPFKDGHTDFELATLVIK